ncbi:chromosome transmission fidelity protein 18 homolog [Chrysoperla carnea]|uniref:chromosome transmission fidelity protein 18 homolog n=1 Tax=Chrysoperla carnea TaxID=189513 RepID=UPI001D071E55|nr:chromosome transmission fidelity protein 18 homolog [Chrysoperla carnea]
MDDYSEYEMDAVDPDEYEAMLEEEERERYEALSSNQNNVVNKTSDNISTQASMFTQPATSEKHIENDEGNIPSTVQRTRKDFSTVLASIDGFNDSNTDDFTDIYGFENENQNKSKSKKRSIEDVFGDIDDIILEEQIRKKPKDDTRTKQLALIDRILEMRKLYKEQYNAISSITGSVTNSRHNVTYNRNRNLDNISEIVPRWPSIPIKKANGERLYIRFHSEQYMEEELQNVASKNDFKGFIGSSFKPVWEEAQKIVGKLYSNENKILETKDEIVIDDSNQLWVEKYKPRKYFELLSDEETNKTLLRWIKLWDKLVFNRAPKIKAKPKEPTSKWEQKQEMEFKLDEDNRPLHKVALLCGPPGLGKTTLAHMIAKHAGYNVVEINASDDRSVEAFKNVLENATQMKSVLDKENRPNCLILDEIDGAPIQAVDYLIKFINGTHKVKGKKAGKKPSILKRPVICICNDVYTPALRNLRAISFVIHFPSIANTRLSERLMQIARLQNVKTDVGALLALCEKTQNDIRACLSVLHFFKSQNKPVKLTDVYKSNIGQKDTQKTLFNVWEEIFQIRRCRPNEIEQCSVINVLPTLDKRLHDILRTVGSFGEYDRLMLGVFENYLKLNLTDFKIDAICDGLDWFMNNDILNKVIYEHQNFVLLPYVQYSFVMWHFLFSTLKKPKIVYPNADYEALKKSQETKSILRDLVNGMAPKMRIYVQTTPFVCDTSSYILDIICPQMNSVNISLLKSEDKKVLENVVDVMISYNLNYIQERDETGTYTFRLDPNIEQLINFGKNQNEHRQLSYSAKQLIAREVELEKMRRLELNIADFKIGGDDMETSQLEDPSISSTPTRSTQNHLMKLQPKQLGSTTETTKKVYRDFFGRIISQPVLAASVIQREVSNMNKGDIWYHFKEGYNNAVRKNIKIDYFK